MINCILHNLGKMMLYLWFTDKFLNVHNVELARDIQDMRIRKKKRQTIRPLPGSLFLTKTSGISRIPLKAAVNGKPPTKYTQKQARPELPLCLFKKKKNKQLNDMFVFMCFFFCFFSQLYSHGVHQHVCDITSETAESFRFNLQQFISQEAFIDGGGVQLADGGWLIPSSDGMAGKEEFYRYCYILTEFNLKWWWYLYIYYNV